jgi:23S rRNA pseudouridine2605 synthase
MKLLRLQQILSKAGVASRRRAEALITEGRVSVNGEVVTTLGAKAHPEEDVVTVDGERVGAAQEPATIVLHKPRGVMTTLDDPQGRETVADLVRDEPYRFVPVGRLDYQTEGLLLLTTDGELVNRLLHPSYHVPKVYQVRVKGRLRAPALDALREGVELDDGPTRPTVVELLEEGERTTWIEIVVTEGRNRLVRRMVDAVGHPAQRVVRTEMATLDLGALKPGQYTYLASLELSAVYRTAGLPAPKLCARALEAAGEPQGKARRGRGPLPGAPADPPSPDRAHKARGRRAGRGEPDEARRPKGTGGEARGGVGASAPEGRQKARRPKGTEGEARGGGGASAPEGRQKARRPKGTGGEARGGGGASAPEGRQKARRPKGTEGEARGGGGASAPEGRQKARRPKGTEGEARGGGGASAPEGRQKARWPPGRARVSAGGEGDGGSPDAPRGRGGRGGKSAYGERRGPEAEPAEGASPRPRGRGGRGGKSAHGERGGPEGEGASPRPRTRRAAEGRSPKGRSSPRSRRPPGPRRGR